MAEEQANLFPRGILRAELLVGVITAVSAVQARVNLSFAGDPTGAHFEARRYGRGEVGELVLIEGQVELVLGRLTDVQVPESERKKWPRRTSEEAAYVVGYVQFLGTVRTDTLRVSAGVASYPRLGDRVFAAPHEFVAQIPALFELGEPAKRALTLNLGLVAGTSGANVHVRPEKVFGRHAAILGATGGGKSWTVARLIEESRRYACKILLVDATGEYRAMRGDEVVHVHLGEPVAKADGSLPCSLPASNFDESDFCAIFEPSGKAQGPKLKDAIRSLRLVRLDPSVGIDGLLVKENQARDRVERLMKRFSAQLENPKQPFDARLLAKQITNECVWPPGADGRWGRVDSQSLTWCLPLQSRIQLILQSVAFRPVFGAPDSGALPRSLDEFFLDFLRCRRSKVLRLCMGGVPYEYRARQVFANAVGRILLNAAREGAFANQPVVVFVDEAHHFLGQSVGNEDNAIRLDAFELIAREGRKYGLNICLATQRPRDLTEGVLSQMGTLIVHRLTNDRDREIVERACGEIDRQATAFLANLRQGEAAVIGVDFPIPLTVKIGMPSAPPASDGPDFQAAWVQPEDDGDLQDSSPVGEGDLRLTAPWTESVDEEE